MRSSALKRASPAMREALDMLIEGPIRWWGGGYWGVEISGRVPGDGPGWVTRSTLNALERRGLAAAHQNHVWRETEYRITDAGRALHERSRAP